MSDDSSYQKLIDHIKNWVIPLPESELLLPIMKMRYTSEEAEFLSTFPLVPLSSRTPFCKGSFKKVGDSYRRA